MSHSSLRLVLLSLKLSSTIILESFIKNKNLGFLENPRFLFGKSKHIKPRIQNINPNKVKRNLKFFQKFSKKVFTNQKYGV